jgi:predicted Zn-dependent peptidase
VGWSLDDVLGFKQRVENVTLEDVNRVGRNLLVRARSVTGLLVPQSVAQTGSATTSSKSANEN